MSWDWLPIDHRPLKTGKYIVGNRGHQEIMHFAGPDTKWVPSTQLGWHPLGHSWNLPADDPKSRFNATHCVLLQTP